MLRDNPTPNLAPVPTPNVAPAHRPYLITTGNPYCNVSTGKFKIIYNIRILVVTSGYVGTTPD